MKIMLKITYNLINFLIFSFPKVIKKATFFRQEIDLSIDQLFLDSILKFLKKSPNFQFTILNEMTAIDFFTKSTRFIVTYKLLSIRYNLRLSISVFLKKPEVFSVNQQFNSSIWLEREIWDLYGIYFLGNKDLRRILTDYGFFGHPLRKNFPLCGFYEKIYSDIHNIIFLTQINNLYKN